MAAHKIIRGETEEDVLAQLRPDFADADMLQYDAIIEQAGRKIMLAIDIDPGGGFEGGFETTTLTAPLQTTPTFSFAIHHEGLLDEIGKFFGMQDVVTGYAEFDKKVVVKTDNEERVRSLFASSEVRNVFGSLAEFSLGITSHEGADEKVAHLELTIERGIVDFHELQSIYSAFFAVLEEIDQ